MANKTTFTKDNQPKNRRGKSEKTKLLEALKRHHLDESEFYYKFLERALNVNDPSSSTLLKEVFARMYPASRPTLPTVKFELPPNATPSERVVFIEKAIANGDIPADIGKMMVDIIKTGIDVANASDLIERLEKLEKLLNGITSNA